MNHERERERDEEYWRMLILLFVVCSVVFYCYLCHMSTKICDMHRILTKYFICIRLGMFAEDVLPKRRKQLKKQRQDLKRCGLDKRFLCSPKLMSFCSEFHGCAVERHPGQLSVETDALRWTSLAVAEKSVVRTYVSFCGELDSSQYWCWDSRWCPSPTSRCQLFQRYILFCIPSRVSGPSWMFLLIAPVFGWS